MVINLKYISLSAIALISSFAHAGDSLAPEIGQFDTKELSYAFELTVPELPKAFIDLTPTDRKDGIPVGELGVDGGKAAVIVKLAKEIANNEHDLHNSLLISHKGKLVFESYYSRGRVNLPHFQASTTKSYTSLAVGRAIQLGYLTMADLDKPIVSFLKGLDKEKLVDGADTITLHQAMSMQSGIRVSREKLKEIRDNPKLQKGLGQVQAILANSEAISPQSQTFNYQPADTRLIMQVLDSVVPGSANDFINKELLEKLGISIYGWKNDVNGLPRAYNGASLTSRDMLKFGIVFLNKGKYKSEQLISPAYIAKATDRTAVPNDGWLPEKSQVSKLSYGYYMWRADTKFNGKTYDIKFAWGGGGQYILTLDALDLVVVITAHEPDDKALAVVPHRILSAFVK